MAMRRLNRTMSRVSRTLTTGIRRGAFLAVAGITALAGATWKVMQQFSKIEDAEAAFTPLLGGAKKATEMVKALNDTAATTPFQFENLAGAAKQLLPNMGGDITRTIELIRMLGDTAGGNAQKMDSIVRGYNKALLKGKVDMESLNMIAEAGVPIFNDLGAVVGKSGTKLFKAISAGKISTEDLTKALQKMTGKGGIFFEGMKIASETLSGKVSTLKDNVGLAAAELGTVLAPVLKDTTDYLIDVSKQAKQWIIQNKAIIRTKLDKFIKKIPEYLEKIVYWGPKIAYLIGTFYAITGAVKVTNTAMTLFNALANINLGPLKAVGAFMGKTLPMKIGLSTAAVAAFQTALIGIGIFVAAWGIQKLLREKLVEPFLEARHQAKMLRAEHEHTMSGDLAKRNEAVLEGDLTRVNKLIAKEEKALQGRRRNRSYISGMASMYGGSTDILDPAEATLRNLRSDRARLLQARNIAHYSGGDPVSDEWNIVTHQGTSTTKEEVEITIKDETTGKRATVTKGSSGRLKLVHTGGMP
jgi:tape measure domain-containing protein